MKKGQDKYRVFQKDLNIFYSGHRDHRTWHPVIFFLWGYVKDNAYKPPLPQNVRELQDRIRAAVQSIDGNMLKRVWQERLSYWHLQSNEGAHIEHLWADFGKLGHLHYLCVKLYLILTINT